MSANHHSSRPESHLPIRMTDSWSAADALLVSAFLEDVLSAIWEHHGDDMLDLLEQRRLEKQDDSALPEFDRYDIPF